MKLIPNGVDFATGLSVADPFDEADFSDRIAESMDPNAQRLRGISRATTTAGTSRGELERKPVDPGDPRAVGWTYLINGDDPDRKNLIRSIAPLAEHRDMIDPTQPLLYRAEETDWFEWLTEHYLGLPAAERPLYLLILGGPESVPFRLQSLLDVAGCVGRLAFDSIEDLERYVEKVIRLETSPQPEPTSTAVFFATDHGPADATYFSRQYMAEPLAELTQKQGTFETIRLFGSEATKRNLLEASTTSRPALVYTASHGIADPSGELDRQQRYNGAILCQDESAGQPLQERLLSADDVPTDEPFLEGAVFFQFACYGYGTPAESEFDHWRLGKPGLNAQEDFVAALPKRLLAHPHGPIGYIGHLDTAWLHAFDDPLQPHPIEPWHPRLSPFRSAVELLLGLQPCAYSMEDMNLRYDVMNAQLTNMWDQMRRSGGQRTPSIRTKLAASFIMRSDAQNYHVMGDPAARLRVRDPVR
jgi:hypothetical protein